MMRHLHKVEPVADFIVSSGLTLIGIALLIERFIT